MAKDRRYRISVGICGVLTLLAVWTAWPMRASKPNALGYYSHCSFAPWSTIILLGLAGASCIIRAERQRRQGRRPPA